MLRKSLKRKILSETKRKEANIFVGEFRETKRKSSETRCCFAIFASKRKNKTSENGWPYLWPDPRPQFQVKFKNRGTAKSIQFHHFSFEYLVKLLKIDFFYKPTVFQFHLVLYKENNDETLLPALQKQKAAPIQPNLAKSDF